MAKSVNAAATDALPAEREHLQRLLLANPNHFGNLPDWHPMFPQFKPVKIIKGDTTYEQLSCVGYNPESRTLTGIVKINRNNGFLGGSCGPGSKEYVRFFIDYHDGAGWQDLGVQSFDAHDIVHTGKDPFNYAVAQSFVPKVENCCFEKPVLPTVRAILSWNVLPPADNPAFNPVWGNVVNVNIQIAPEKSIICLIKNGLGILQTDLPKIQVAKLVKSLPQHLFNQDAVQALSADALPEASITDLVKAYGKDVEPERAGFAPVVKALSAGGAYLQALHTTFAQAKLDISKVVAFLNNPKFNTTYEEIRCVGLDRNTSTLHATVQMKKASGYSGGLCSKGSREYVAFYMDFGDGGGWRYMGTSSVGTHDINPVPGDGLSYEVSLPVNLLPYQKKSCQDVYLAKVRAILSWNLLPPPNNPGWVAPWGNWQEAWVEIKNSGIVVSGDSKPYLLTIGTLPADKVSTITGLVDQTLGAPDATVDGYHGYSFNGTIPLTGLITAPPDSDNNPAAQMKYRIMLKKAGQPDSAFAPVTNTFKVLRTVISGGMPVQTVVDQVAQLGYYNYLVDYHLPTIVSVHGDLLGELQLPDSGVYEFYIETNNGFQTGRYRVKNDIHAPKDVHIHIDNGQDCGTLKQGTPVTGTYTLADAENNCLGVSFELLYYPPGTSSALTVDGVARSFGALVPVAPAGQSGIWSITTDHLTPCGYNFRMYAYDKTILCYHTLSYAYGITSQYTYDTLGFCLAKA